MTIEIGKRYKFDYPAVFVTLPDYTAHAGQVVEVVRPLTADEAEPPSGAPDFIEAMFRVRADDGWEGDAWESELV